MIATRQSNTTGVPVGGLQDYVVELGGKRGRCGYEWSELSALICASDRRWKLLERTIPDNNVFFDMIRNEIDCLENRSVREAGPQCYVGYIEYITGRAGNQSSDTTLPSLSSRVGSGLAFAYDLHVCFALGCKMGRETWLP